MSEASGNSYCVECLVNIGQVDEGHDGMCPGCRERIANGGTPRDHGGPNVCDHCNETYDNFGVCACACAVTACEHYPKCQCGYEQEGWPEGVIRVNVYGRQDHNRDRYHAKLSEEEIIAAFESEDREFNKGQNVKERLAYRDDVHVFIFLDKLFPPTEKQSEHGPPDIVSGAEHDKIFLSISTSKLADAGVTLEQVKDLIRCGVMLDSDGYFSMFV